jgi:hypothetical protein
VALGRPRTSTGNLFKAFASFDFVNRIKPWLSRPEVPFIVQGDPQVASSAVERLNMPHYLDSLLGRSPETEYSATSISLLEQCCHGRSSRRRNGHVGGWRRRAAEKWKRPTKLLNVYNEWFHHANVTGDKLGYGMLVFQIEWLRRP